MWQGERDTARARGRKDRRDALVSSRDLDVVAKQLARLWHQGREAYLDEGRSEPNVNKELGSTVLGLGSERLGGGLVAGLEESGEVERHLQEEREQSGMR
jgi:hypothetical protein